MANTMGLAGAVTGLVLALFGIAASGRLTIRFLSNITTALGVSEFTVAFVLLAVATSLPETFVAATSALQHANDIIIATVLGSNIINITLVTGLAGFFSGGIKTDQLHLRRDLLLCCLISALPIIFVLNGTISRIESWTLLVIFLLYLAFLAHDQIKYSATRMPRRIVWGVASIFFALGAIAILLYSSSVAVSSSVALAALIGIPSFVIGIFLLAVGTSLPEMVTTIQSNRMGKPALALGNIIGSNITNSTLVLGLAGAISPIRTSLHPSLIVTAAAVIASTLGLTYLATRRGELSVFDSLKLLTAFVMFGAAIALTQSLYG